MSKKNTTNNTEELNKVVTDALVLKGTIFSIHIHDASMAEDSFTVTNMLQSIAQGIQRQRIKAEDIIQSMEDSAQRRLQAGEFDPETGEPLGLTPQQEILMDKLEDQLDVITYIQKDLAKLWDEQNNNPEYKLYWQTDAERRKRAMEFQYEQQAKKNAEDHEVLEINRKIREARREARQARLAS